MTIGVLIILAILSYAAFEIFSARAGGSIDANLSSIVFNGLGVLVPLVFYVFMKMTGERLIDTTSRGMWSSLLAGIAIAVFSVSLIKIFEKGGELSYVIPLIYGGSIIIAAAYGIMVLKDDVTPLSIVGIVLITLGIGVIIASKYKFSF
jgi:transporter family protein